MEIQKEKMNTSFRYLTRHVVPLTLVLRLVTLTTPDSLAVAATVPVGATVERVAVTEPIAEHTRSQLPTLDQFLTATNQERRSAGLPTLKLNQTLNRAATAKVEDMVAKGYWDHFRPTDHKAPWDFMTETGYTYKAAGENLARGFKTAAGITQAWMASPSHRANILSEHYTEVGFAVAETTDEQGETILLTVQFFGGH